MARQITVPDNCLEQIAITEPCEGLRATSGWMLSTSGRATARGVAFFPQRGREFEVRLCASICPKGGLTGLWVAEPLFGQVLGRAKASALPNDPVFEGPATVPSALHFDNPTGLFWSRGVWGKGWFDAASCLRLPGRLNEGNGWLDCHEWRLPTLAEVDWVAKRDLFNPGGPLAGQGAPSSIWATSDKSGDQSILVDLGGSSVIRVLATEPSPAEHVKAPILLVTESMFD